MASLENQLRKFFKFDKRTMTMYPLTVKEISQMTKKIKEIPQKFKEECEKIRLGALEGKNKYHAPRTIVLGVYISYRDKLKEWASKEILENYEDKEKDLVINALEDAIQEVKYIKEEYSPPYSEEQGPLVVKFKPRPIPTNKTEYDGPGHPKVETPLNFEPAPFADPEFIEQHRRKDPCNCTIL